MMSSVKLVSIVALLQFLAISFGFLVTKTFLDSLDEWIVDLFLIHSPVVSRFTLFMYSFGLWFQWLPLIWIVVSIIRIHRSGNVPSASGGPEFVSGIILFAALALLFVLSAAGAWHMFFTPVITGTSSSSATEIASA